MDNRDISKSRGTAVPKTTMTSKAALLFSLFPRHPVEFYDRVMTFLEVRLEHLWVMTRRHEYEILAMEEAVRAIEKAFAREIHSFLNEQTLKEIEGEVLRSIESIRSDAPFTLAHNIDFILARFCYLVCRVLKPNVVLETGVAYGVSSAFILKALEVNGQGILHSVDLPPLGCEADRFVGILIPEKLKARWRLYKGVSKRVLPRLLPLLDQVDMFVHDSLHTYRNMLREFQMVTPYLSRPSVVIADDVDGNLAFLEWADKTCSAFWATLHEADKQSLFGLNVLL